MSALDVVTTGSFIPRDQLGLEFDEISLDYLDSEFTVKATPETDGSTRYDVVPAHESLKSAGLRELLGRITVGQNLQESPRAIIADWDIVDRAQTRRGSERERAQELVDLHQGLGGAWQEFMKSRPEWLSLLIDEDDPRFHGVAPWHHNPFMNEERVDLRDVLETIARSGSKGFEILVEAMGISGVDNPDEVVFSGLRQSINARRGQFSQVKGDYRTKRHVMSVGIIERTTMLTRLLQGMDADQLDAFVEFTRDNLYQTYEAPSGTRYYVRSVDIKDPLEIVMQSAEPVERGGIKATAVTINQRYDRKKRVLVPESVDRSGMSRELVPLLSWRNMDGKREFIIERRTEEVENGVVFYDGVLGVMLAAYMAPELTATWPDRMKVPRTDSREMEIGAVQVPIIALMRRGQLLKTEFITAAEAVSK